MLLYYMVPSEEENYFCLPFFPSGFNHSYLEDPAGGQHAWGSDVAQEFLPGFQCEETLPVGR